MPAFTIGIIQDHATADAAANVARAEQLVRDAAGRGAQIICLKELFNAPYFCKSQQCDRFDLAEPIPGPTTDAMQALAQRARRRHHRADLRAAGRRASTATRPPSSTPTARCSASTARCTSRDDPLFNEKYYFTPGRRAPGLPRRAARRGQRLPGLEDALRDDRRADLLGPVVSGGGAHHRAARRRGAVLSDRHRLAPGREGRVGRRRRSRRGARSSARTPSPTASTSRRRIASATRTSRARTASTFFGHSFIADPFGRFVAEAGERRRDRSSRAAIRRCIETVRRNWPFLRDRRVDAYGPILNRYLGA